MKKGQIYEGIVTRVDFPNKGIVDSMGEQIVVKNTLPGQKIRCMVNKVRKGKAEARLLEVIERSPLECGDTCSHFGVCGGCTYLSLDYQEQLSLKEQQVKKLLDGVLTKQEIPYVFEGIKGSPKQYHYRNKMEFSFGDEYKDGPLSVGLHKRGSFYDLVDIRDCKIIDSDYQLILNAVRDFVKKEELPFLHRMTHVGYLRHLLVRKASSSGEILIALVTTSQVPDTVKTFHEEELYERFLQMLLSLQNSGKLNGSIEGILHIVNDSQSDVVKCDRLDLLYGRDFIYEKLLGLTFKISVFSFFQTNTYSAAVLYDTVREYVGEKPGSVVFDLYSGTGTIAQLMAAVAKQVIGVEIIPEAVEAAKLSAKANGLENCSFYAGDVLQVLDEIPTKPDFIILDPPRDGIHPKALPKIINYQVDRIVYISCKPTSLTRDLEVFLENGYHIEKAVVVDQFPWTANAETVALIVKNP